LAPLLWRQSPGWPRRGAALVFLHLGFLQEEPGVLIRRRILKLRLSLGAGSARLG
jgi:hypothetical protein